MNTDGVACTALEVSESSLSCCWVTELQGRLTTSLRTVGHSGGVEAVGSGAWSSPLPFYPDTWDICNQGSDLNRSGRSWGGAELQSKHVAISEMQIKLKEDLQMQ